MNFFKPENRLICNEFNEYLNNVNKDASIAFNLCISKAKDYSMIIIPKGSYYIQNRVAINKKNIAFVGAGDADSISRFNSYTQCLENESNCPKLLYSSKFKNDQEPNTLFVIAASNVKVARMIFDGGKNEFPDPPKSRQSLYITGPSTDVGIFASIIKNSTGPCAVCVFGKQINFFTFQNNAVIENGFHKYNLTTKKSYWSDGMSIQGSTVTNNKEDLDEKGKAISGNNFQILDNLFRDNTDIDLILGSGPNALIKGNRIVHTGAGDKASWAGIMLQSWPFSSGNFDGALVENNTVSCPQGTCGFGILVGTDPWRDFSSLAGPFISGKIKLTNNIIETEIIGLAIIDSFLPEVPLQTSASGNEIKIENNKIFIKKEGLVALKKNTSNLSKLTNLSPLLIISNPRVNVTTNNNTLFSNVNSKPQAKNPLFLPKEASPFYGFLPLVIGDSTNNYLFQINNCDSLLNPTNDSNRITLLYCMILNSKPESQEELNFWTSEISVKGISSVVQSLIFNKKLKELLPMIESESDFIKLLYITLLNSEVDTQGLNFWLNQKLDRKSLIQKITEQNEFKKIMNL